MVLGVSTRNYVRSIEPAPPGLKSRGTSKSAVSRRFVTATREMLSRDLGALALCSIMIDGIHIDTHLVLVALETLRSGVSGLVIAFAKRLNKEILGRRVGKVWAERYHAHELTSPREVKNALSYVYNNYKKHGYTVFGAAFVDPLSSALLFDEWSLKVASMPTEPPAPDTPRTWLLGEGWWKKHGLLHSFASPLGAPKA